MSKILKIILTALAASVSPAHAQSPAPQGGVDIIDFLVDWKKYLGGNVTVKTCQIILAESSGVYCSAGDTGYFLIEGSTLDRESLRRALRSCGAYSTGKNCIADVSGIVVKSLGDPKLTNAIILWKN